MLVANSREEVEARINAMGLRAEKSLKSAKKELKSLSKNELINVVIGVVGFGFIFDNDNIGEVVVKDAEVQAFHTLRNVEMDKINVIIESLALQAMEQQGEDNGTKAE